MAKVTIHRSVGRLQRKRLLAQSLKQGRIHPRLVYETTEQSQKWWKIHQKYSPVQKRATFQIYLDAFDTFLSLNKAPVQIVSLGCGGGNKDARFVKMLLKAGQNVEYLPIDISRHLVEEASRTIQKISRSVKIFGMACDLECVQGLCTFLRTHPSPNRVILFFGMLPNMRRDQVWKTLSQVLVNGDTLIFSANLSPGKKYKEGIRSVLYQYDNPETRDWLLTFWDQLGVPRSAGTLSFEITQETGSTRFNRSLMRIQVRYHLNDSKIPPRTARRLKCILPKRTTFELFFSNRYHLPLLNELGAQLGLKSLRHWISPNQQEAVMMGRVGSPPSVQK